MLPRTRYCSRCLTTFVTDVESCPNLSCRSVRPAGGWGELLEKGDIIDRTYRVLERLAIGGAGVTYLCREIGEQEDVGPRVAIKLLYQQRDQGPYLRRLATEAQILQTLNHPNIVECLGFVHRAGHSPYLVTRYEAGGSLLDHIHRVGVLSVRITAAIGVQVCNALTVAHAQGVIHRDLKPENVLLERQVLADTVPCLRLADFGIAKVFGGVGERLTRVGAFVGTPQFAAPEQFEGANPDPATDVYATAAMLYNCLMGRPVAGHMDALDPDQQLPHLLSHLPPRLARPDLPPEEVAQMEAILAKAMAPQPQDRCSIQELATLLSGVSAPPPDLAQAGRTITIPGQSLPPQGGTQSGNMTFVPSHNEPALPKARTSQTQSNKIAKPAATTSSRWGCMAGVFGLGAIGAMALLLVAGLWWQNEHSIRTISTDDSEWESITRPLGVVANRANAGVCKPVDGLNPKPPENLYISVVIDGKGHVESLALTNWSNETTRKCLEDQVKLENLPRSHTDTIQLSIALDKRSTPMLPLRQNPSFPVIP